MRVEVLQGNIVEANAEVIVNTWNRNIFPWFLLIPQGVSGAIKRQAGWKPFHELMKFGPMPLGSAKWTTAGRLKYKGIIHVAGINMLWRASKASIRDSVLSAIEVAKQHGVKSIAFPVIGAGSGGFDEEKALNIMMEALSGFSDEIDVQIIRFQR